MCEASARIPPEERKLSREEVIDAIRFGVTSELDAITTYLQFARGIDDEKVRSVFEDIAREEMTHVGEFLALLLRLDEQQARELKRGFEEVKELTGFDALAKLED